jgi:undecaprenyl-diphosphatase
MLNEPNVTTDGSQRIERGHVNDDVFSADAGAELGNAKNTAEDVRSSTGRIASASKNSVRVLGSADSKIDSLIHPARSKSALSLVKRLSHLGDGGAVWLLMLAASSRRSPRSTLKAIAVLGLGAVLVNGPLKSLTKRDRPEPLEGQNFQPHGSSFPSGHAFSSWLVAGMLPRSHPLKTLATLLATAISSSRVFLRYHHASDVVAGSALGIAAGWSLRNRVKLR